MEAKPRFRRRFFQFSLSTFLIAVTGISIWLGYEFNSARNQEQAVELVLSHGGKVVYDYELIPDTYQDFFPRAEGDGILGLSWDSRREVPGPPWLRDMIGEHFFKGLAQARFFDEAVEVNDDDLEVLCRAPTIEFLWLNNAKVSDDGMQHLRKLKALRVLVLSQRDTHISDEGFAVLSANTDLEMIALNHTKISDNGLRHLRRLRKLQYLALDQEPPSEESSRRHTTITDEGLPHLYTCENLRLIQFRNTSLTDEGRAELRKRLPRLLIEDGSHADQ